MPPAEMTRSNSGDTDALDLLLAGRRRVRRFTPTFTEAQVRRALAVSPEIGEIVRHRQAPVRKSFIRRSAKSDPRPPAARLLAASGLYLKMELTLLWVSGGRGVKPEFAQLTEREQRTLRARRETGAADADDATGIARLLPTDAHTAQFPLAQYAALLGQRPTSAGVARVRRAIGHLSQERLIYADRGDGLTPRTMLRREDGSGAAYELPSPKRVRIDAATGITVASEGRFIPLPSTFWTNGWAAALSGRALLALLVVRTQHDLAPDRPAFVAPSIRSDLFGLSADTFSRGIAELDYFNLVQVTPGPVAREGWARSPARRRHMYVPRFDAFGESPLDFL